MRRLLFWMHLGSGVPASTLVFFFSVTGALLAYERPIMHAADARAYQADPVPRDTMRIPIDTLVARTAAEVRSPLETVTVHQDPTLPVEIETASHYVYFANPYSGSVQGPVLPRLRAFFGEITALHRWFGLSNAHHATATVVKGATALLLLFLLLSGTFLWMPGRWTHSSLRAGIVPRFDLDGRARNYSWHKVTGFWIALPLAVIVMTGVIMAYPWANAQLFRLARSPLPVRSAQGAPRRHAIRGQAPPNHLDEAFAQATNNIKGWQSASLRLPPSPAALSFIVDRSDGGHPEKREQVLIDARTLQVLRREPFTALSRGRQWRSWVRFAHTGEAGGWWGETLAIVTACGAAVLSLTGVALSFDRLQRSRR